MEERMNKWLVLDKYWFSGIIEKEDGLSLIRELEEEMVLRVSPQTTTLKGALRSLKAQGCREVNLGALIRLLSANIQKNPSVLHKDIACARLYTEGLALLTESRGEPSQTKVLARLASGLQADGSPLPRTEKEESRAYTKSLVDQVEKAITKAITKTRERKRKVVTKGRPQKSIKTLARLASGLEE